MVPPGPRGDDPYEGGAAPDDWPAAPRPYPTRPFPTRPFPTRPFPTRGYADYAPDLRPFPTRPFPTRPFPTRPFPTRPFPTRPFPTRPDADAAHAEADARLDAHEWTADVSDLFVARSAVIGLGARLLFGRGRIPVPQVAGGQALPTYKEEPEARKPADKKPRLPKRVAKAEALVALQHLWPGLHELAWKLILPDDLARDLAEEPESAWALKDDVARALALGVDTSVLGGGPLIGVNQVAGNPLAAAAPDVQARAMLAAVCGRAGVVFDYAGWIFSAKTLAALAGAAQGNRTWDSTFLLTPDGADGGLLLGYPFIISKAAGDRIYFSSDWSEAWIGVERRVVTVDISTDVEFQRDETVIRAVAHHDLVIRKPELFVVGLVE